MMKFLSPLASKRMAELASSPYRPPQIIKLKEDIEAKTKALELKTSVSGQVSQGEIDKIVRKFKIDNKENRTVECLLSKELGNLIKSGKLIMHVYPTNDKWFGVTNPEDEAIVRKMLSDKK